jgi:hypothetical protein
MLVSEDETGLGVIEIRRYLQAQASMPRRHKTVAAIADVARVGGVTVSRMVNSIRQPCGCEPPPKLA